MVVLNAYFVQKLFPSKRVLCKIMCWCNEGALNNLVQVLAVTDSEEILKIEEERYSQMYREEDLVVLGSPRSITAMEDEEIEIPLSPEQAAQFFRDMTKKFERRND